MRRIAAAFVLVCCALAARPLPAAAEPAGPPLEYLPPVAGPVIDGFRPPPESWAEGNRGIDLATADGESVVASAPGEVVFAGPVAGSLHVVVLHADGLRTSYSFLASVLVRRGQRVAAGEAVGTAAASVHFGVRAGDAYLDPAALLGGGPPTVHLVPDGARRPLPERQERGALERLVRSLPGRLGRAAAAGVSWARDAVTAAAGAAVDAAATAARAEVRRQLALASERFDELKGWYHYAWAFGVERSPLGQARRLAAAVRAWEAQRSRCTPPSSPPPPRPGRRLLVEVAGLGSQTGDDADPAAAGAIAELDPAALGYRAGDVVEFSYAGGTTAERPYRAADTQVSLRESARRLRALLERLARDHPGVPVDLVAHSQGGLVARAALAFEADEGDRRLPVVANLVTLGTPHHGADLATAVRVYGHTNGGGAALRVAGALRPFGLDPTSAAVRDLAETSPFIADLGRAPLPAGVRFTSIAARADLAVASGAAHVEGATNVVVDPGGTLDQHDRLPGSAVAAREVALALAGAAPTCESLVDALVDAQLGEAIAATEDALGAAGAYLLRRATG